MKTNARGLVNQCSACAEHQAHMQDVWTGLEIVYRKQLTDARRSRRTNDVKRLTRLLSHVASKASAPPTACPVHGERP